MSESIDDLAQRLSVGFASDPPRNYPPPKLVDSGWQSQEDIDWHVAFDLAKIDHEIDPEHCPAPTHVRTVEVVSGQTIRVYITSTMVSAGNARIELGFGHSLINLNWTATWVEA